MLVGYLILSLLVTYSLAGRLPTDDRMKFEKLGLYESDSKSKLTTLPLRNMTINATITGAYGYVQLHQHYINTYDYPIETVYLFPRSETSVFDQFVATTKDKVVRGVIMEKQEAKEKYEEHKAKGDTVAYAEIDSLLQDVMMLKIGNLPPGEEMIITFGYIQPLSVALNSYWGFTIYSTLTERYTPKHSNQPTTAITTTENQIYTWKIYVEINSLTPIQLIKTPGYSAAIHQSDDGKKALMTPYGNQNYVPNQDFVLYFRNDELFVPKILVEKHPKYENDYLGLISFFPQLNKLSAEEAYEFLALNPTDEEMAAVTLNEDRAKSRAEFIFIADRSGSMSGARVEKLKKALDAFMQILPTDSYFNIISFGSNFNSLFPASTKTSTQSIELARKALASFDADYGGTEILNPIRSAVDSPSLEGYPRSVILLTDGDVSNADEIIDYVRVNSNNVRVCSVGIGSGTSPYLLSNIAKYGNCAAEFVRDEDDLTQQARKLVQMSISHVLTDFQIETVSKKHGIISSTIPAAEKLPIIPKNTAFKMWVRFNPEVSTPDDSVTFKISCKNSFTGTTLKFEIPLDLSGAIESEFFHKVETSEVISNLRVENFRNRGDNEYKKKIVELSLKYQVLSEETAFFALINEKAVAPNSTQTVNIPSIESVDYRNSMSAGKLTIRLIFMVLMTLLLLWMA